MEIMGPCSAASREITAEEFPKPTTVESFKPGFNIYPNPTNGNFIITLNLKDDNTGDKTIQIINSNGQVVKRIHVNNQNNLNIKVDNAGIYLIQLITGKQVITKKLFVVH
jgi:hypothetical protein